MLLQTWAGNLKTGWSQTTLFITGWIVPGLYEAVQSEDFSRGLAYRGRHAAVAPVGDWRNLFFVPQMEGYGSVAQEWGSAWLWEFCSQLYPWLTAWSWTRHFTSRVMCYAVCVRMAKYGPKEELLAKSISPKQCVSWHIRDSPFLCIIKMNWWLCVCVCVHICMHHCPLLAKIRMVLLCVIGTILPTDSGDSPLA